MLKRVGRLGEHISHHGEEAATDGEVQLSQEALAGPATDTPAVLPFPIVTLEVVVELFSLLLLVEHQEDLRLRG